MNAKAFYLAVGEIDDDLIQEAEAAPAKSRRPFYRYLAAAACICVAALALFLSRPRDDIRFNTLPAPPSARIAIQGNEVVMSESEASAYYDLTLPETLDGLIREAPLYFVRYETAGGNVTFDENTVRYRTADGIRSLSVSVSKAPVPSFIQTDKDMYSRLDGATVLLAITGEQEPSYWAELHRGGTAIHIVSSGFTEPDFIELIREIIHL